MRNVPKVYHARAESFYRNVFETVAVGNFQSY